MRSLLEPSTGRQDLLDGLGGQRTGTSMRRRAAVVQAFDALLEEAPDPFVDGGTRDRGRLGDASGWPAMHQDSFDDDQAAEWREASPTMDHREPPSGSERSTPNRERRLSSVNNLGGNYT